MQTLWTILFLIALITPLFRFAGYAAQSRGGANYVVPTRVKLILQILCDLATVVALPGFCAFVLYGSGETSGLWWFTVVLSILAYFVASYAPVIRSPSVLTGVYGLLWAGVIIQVTMMLFWLGGGILIFFVGPITICYLMAFMKRGDFDRVRLARFGGATYAWDDLVADGETAAPFATSTWADRFLLPLMSAPAGYRTAAYFSLGALIFVAGPVLMWLCGTPVSEIFRVYVCPI